MTGSDGQSPPSPPYGFAVLTAAAVLALYIVTIAPTTQFWDTSEYIAAAKVLGIPHPPGNPLFVLIAHVWGMVPLVAHYALRINLLAAVTSAASAGLLFLVAERFLRPIVAEVRPRLLTAFAGALVGATSFTVWHQSTVNAKVYTLSLFSIALVLWLVVRWGDLEAGPRRNRLLILIIYLLALTTTNHLMGLLVAPAVFIYVLHTDIRALLNGRMWTMAIVVVAVGLSVVVFLWFRAPHFPAINEGEPTTWQALLDVLQRRQYQKPPLTERQADFTWQLANYWQYFTWQFGRDWTPAVRNPLAIFFASVGLYGAVRQWKKDRPAAVAMIALMSTITLLLVFYLNFKYGYSIRPNEQLTREVRERDYFFIASFQLWGVWVALGFGSIIATLAAFSRNRLGAETGWSQATPVLVFCLIPLLGNRLTASRAGETLARDFSVDLLESLEPYAVLITAGDNDMFPLWYAQEVEGVRRDVVLANQSLMNTRWHLRQIKRRPIFPFDSVNAVVPYRGRSWPQPTEPPLRATFEELDSLPIMFSIPENSEFRAGNIRISLPRELILQRRDIATLRLIGNNLGTRPIYFARTTGAYADQLGLTPHLLGQGLARKLVADPIEASDSTVFSQTLGWIDVKRTRSLILNVYHSESAARKRPRGWIDEPSEGILMLYGLVYAGFAEILARQAGTSESDGPDLETQELIGRLRALSRNMLRQTSFGRE